MGEAEYDGRVEPSDGTRYLYLVPRIRIGHWHAFRIPGSDPVFFRCRRNAPFASDRLPRPPRPAARLSAPVEPARTRRHAVPRFLTTLTAVVLLWATIPQAPAQSLAGSPEWNLATLMTALHRRPVSSSARFVEVRTFHLLNQPQRSSGRLLYVAPSYLQKTTTEPAPSRLTVSGNQLTIEQQGQPTHAIGLQDYSGVGTLVDSIRATLAGDLPALTRSFTTALAGGPNDWTLTLEPRDEKLRKMVTSIRFQGQQNTIRDVLTLQADGDRSDMSVTPEPQ